MSNRRNTNGDGSTLEKDFSHGMHLPIGVDNSTDTESSSDGDYLDPNTDPNHALSRIRTAGSISISPELFEKIYLSPQNKVSGDLRKTVGNPTPVYTLFFGCNDTC